MTLAYTSLWGWLLGRDRAEQIDALNLSDREIALQSLIYQLANRLEGALLIMVEADPHDDLSSFQSDTWGLVWKARSYLNKELPLTELEVAKKCLAGDYE